MNEILQDRPWPVVYTTKGNRTVNISLRWKESNEIESARLTVSDAPHEKIIAELEGPFGNEASALGKAKDYAEAWCETQK